MKRFVIDANIAAKWYLPEEDSDLAERLLELGGEFHAPEFLKTEFASIVWKHSVAGAVSPAVWRLGRDGLGTAIPNWHRDESLLEQALELGLANRHHVFDCLYLALAVSIDGVVITADKQFLVKFSRTEHAGRVISLASALG